MNGNNLQPNTNYNTSFTPNTAPVASQQQAQPQGGPVPALGNTPDLSASPSAKNLQNYSAVAGEPDTFNLPEYQPIKPGEPYMEKLPDEAMNTKKLNICLKNARDNEELGDFKDAEKAYKKALKYTESAEHYKLYAGCLKEIYLALSRIPLTPSKDEAKEKVYKEKAARAFYYLGKLYEKNADWKAAQAAYKASGELALHEVPLKALLDVAQQVGEKGNIVDALDKLADFYVGKGDISTAIKMLEEAVQVEKSSTILEKLAVLCGQAGGEDSQLKVNEARIQQFELQISEDPKNIGVYRKYAWFLKDIGKRNEARAVKERMDELLQALQQKVLKQKTKIGDLKQTIHSQAGKLKTLGKQVEFLERQVIHLDFSSRDDIRDEDLVALLKKNRYIKFLNLEGCRYLTDAGLAALKGLQRLTELNLGYFRQLTDEGLKHLAGLSQLRELNLECCNQLTDADLKHLAGLSQLRELNLECCDQLSDAGLRHLAGLSQLTSLNLYNCNQLTDEGLKHLAGLSQLTSLNLYLCDKFTDAGLEHLAGLSQLTYLNLFNYDQFNCNQFSDAGLEHLASLNQLTYLDLVCTQITDAGLEHLVSLNQLTYLNLVYCNQLTDRGLQHLAGLTQLRELYLQTCPQLTGAGLKHLAGLSQLTSLDLSSCNQLTDAGLQHLASLTQLTSLDLSGCEKLTDAGLQHLASLTQLTSLNLAVCEKLTDVGLQHLAGLTRLTSLNLSSCNKITSNAKEQLKKQIPGLRIYE